MNYFPSFYQTLFKLLGSQGSRWIVICIVASAFLAITDYIVAIVFRVLLANFGSSSTNLSSFGWLTGSGFSLWQLLVVMAIIALMRAVAQLGVYQSFASVEEILRTNLRLLSIYEILKSPSGQFVSASETNTKIGEIYHQAAGFIVLAVNIVSILVQSVLLIVAMAYLAWQESILGLIGFLFIGFLLLKINRRTRVIARKIPQEQKLIVAAVERIARNWLLVKTLRTNEYEYQRLIGSINNYYQNFMKAKFLGNLGAVIPLFLGIFPLIIIIFVSQKIWQTPTGILMSFLFLFSRFLYIFARTARIFGLANGFFPSFKIAVNYASGFSQRDLQEALAPLSLNNPKKDIIASSKTTESRDNRKMQKEMEITELNINNVSFAYHSHSPLILQNFSLKIIGGQQIGLIGRSGSGKSSLIGLITGVLQPTTGVVTINGLESQRFFELPWTRIGYVGSEPFLVEGTIKENLDYGSSESYSFEEYRHALAQAQLLDVIDNLPDGMDYLIDENGEGLSAGQKQRLCLARALLCRPQLLILDEASANLDEETEAQIALSVKKLKEKCTVIIASHKPGILEFSDQIIDMSKK